MPSSKKPSFEKETMVRRTKEETEQTRRRVLAAARGTFLLRGMTGTTLEHIAKAAGVTRGAIYWHFANKKALFEAMRSQVCLPLIDRTDVTLLAMSRADPLGCIEQFLLALLAAVTTCTETRQTFEIMAFKCEYVDEFEKELEEHRRKSGEIAEVLAKVYRRAKQTGQLRPDITPKVAGVETLAFMMGLIRLWLLDQRANIVRPIVPALIAAHVNGRRAAPASDVAAAINHAPRAEKRLPLKPLAQGRRAS
jgi:TetR/AcrR family transcriptional regulator, acrAB operon repressor